MAGREWAREAGRRRYEMRSIVLTVAAAALCASAHGALPGNMPGGTNWLVRFDVEKVMSSGLGDGINKRLAMPVPQKLLAAAKLVTGVAFPDDIKSVTVVGSGREREKVVAYICGTFDDARLTILASLARGYHTEAYAGRVIHVWQDDGLRGKLRVAGHVPLPPRVRTVHATFAREGLVVISENLETLKSAIDALDGNSTGVDFSNRVDEEAFFTVVASGLHELAPREPGALVTCFITDLEYSVKATATEVMSSSRVEITDAETAAQVLEVLEGMQALAALHPEGYPEVAALITRMQFSRDETVLTGASSAGIDELEVIAANTRRVVKEMLQH
jgi:hypothetical protein